MIPRVCGATWEVVELPWAAWIPYKFMDVVDPCMDVVNQSMVLLVMVNEDARVKRKSLKCL
jgi:hypothetical protein